jgi:shikimate dehydrogenase
MSVLRTALIGRNISHSISPRVHEELFSILAPRFGSPYTSIKYDIEECDERCDVADWMKKAQTNGLRGANVTIPYKGDAYALAAERLGVTNAIESANTLAFDRTTTAISTDGQGCLHALLRELPEFNLEKYHLVVIGAGDTARAVVYSLCTRWMPKTLTIVNRTLAHAEELAKFCIAQAPGPTVQVMSIEDLVNRYDEPTYRLVIQATPVGSVVEKGDPAEGFSWGELDLAIDLTYRPLQTQFLSAANAAGAKTMNGLGMLIEQAALAQHFWFTGTLAERSPLSDDEYRRLKELFTLELT